MADNMSPLSAIGIDPGFQDFPPLPSHHSPTSSSLPCCEPFPSNAFRTRRGTVDTCNGCRQESIAATSRTSTLFTPSSVKYQSFSRERPLPLADIDQIDSFWQEYNKAADFEDREFVKTLGANLDTLLIFAGLFSAVNTAFIVESLKTVQEDQALVTNDLLRSAIQLLQNVTPTSGDLATKEFEPAPQGVWSTAIFFASLSCSLTAAFGAVLGKQWLNHYEREGVLKTPASRARERQKKFDGCAEWHMEAVIQTLPIILQVSLFLFLVALVAFLWSINKPIRYIVLALSVLPAIFYLVTTAIAVKYPLSPFQTPVSIAIRSLLSHSKFTLEKESISRHATSVETPFTILKESLRAKVKPLIEALRPCKELFTSVWLHHPHIPKLFSPIIPKWYRNNSVKYTKDVWNLRCLAFYLGRASTFQGLERALVAMDALPGIIKLDGGDSTVSLIGETLLKFVIKPTKTGKDGEYISSLTNIQFQHLLKPLHFLYMSWKNLEYPNEVALKYFKTYRKLVRTRLWEIFSLDPSNVKQVDLIADIMETTDTHDEHDCSDSNLGRLWQCIQRPMQNPADYMPYISLLANSPAHQQLASHARSGGKIANILYATMYAYDQKPDLNHPRASLRARVLPGLVSDEPSADRSWKYFSKCCKRYLVDKNSQARAISRPALEAGPYYLSAIYQLVNRNAADQISPQQFAKMARLLKKVTNEDRNPVASAIAYLSLIGLWYQCRDVAEFSTQLMTAGTLAQVVHKFRVLMDVEDRELEGYLGANEVSNSLECIAYYFEAASRRHLLRQDMGFICGQYQDAFDRYVSDPLKRGLVEVVNALDFSQPVGLRLFRRM